MAQRVRVEKAGDVTVLRLDAQPLNALGAPLRQALWEALDAAAADPEIVAVVLAGAGANFSSGLDIRSIETPTDAPSAGALADRIETLGKPVVAAMQGLCIGAGFELALAASARVVHMRTQVGMPDLVLGLPPGAGGTQRLARMLGAENTLNLVLAGRTGPVSAPSLAPLWDRTERGDPVAAAIDLARELAKAPPPMTRDRAEGFADPAAYQQAIMARRAALDDSPHPAVPEIIACVEAAQLLPFEAGLAMEQAAFEDALTSDHSRALRHIYMAERRAGNMPETRPNAAAPVSILGLVGGGPTASGIAAACLDAGLSVIQFERSEEAVAATRTRLEAQYVAMVRARSIAPGDKEARLGRWKGTAALGDLAKADVILEAVADVLETKKQVFAALDKVAREGAILATQSGLLPIQNIAQATGRPALVVGMHFHLPVTHARLIEVIPGPQTAPDTVATVAELARGPLGRTVLRAGTQGGALGEPVVAALRDAALAMLVDGAAPDRIDRVLMGWGATQGVFRQMDRIGLETVLARGRILAQRGGYPTAHLAALERLIEAGRTGRAAGKGFYDWTEAGKAAPSPEAVQIACGDAQGSAAPMSEDEICLRALAAMANQGARMLRAETALRPSDIDVAMVHGAGFARWHGGPMKAADLLGLFEVLRALKRLSGQWPDLYTPDPGFAALIKNGDGFEVLNRVGKNRRTIPG